MKKTYKVPFKYFALISIGLKWLCASSLLCTLVDHTVSILIQGPHLLRTSPEVVLLISGSCSAGSLFFPGLPGSLDQDLTISRIRESEEQRATELWAVAGTTHPFCFQDLCASDSWKGVSVPSHYVVLCPLNADNLEKAVDTSTNDSYLQGKENGKY